MFNTYLFLAGDIHLWLDDFFLIISDFPIIVERVLLLLFPVS